MSIHSLIKWTGVILLLSQLFICSALKSQSEATWTYPITEKDFEYSQDQWGNVILTEGGKVTCVAPTTGKTMWDLDSGSDKVKVTKIDNTPLLVMAGQKLQLVDGVTGEIYLEDSGTSIDFKNYETFLSKDMIILDYKKDGKDMVSIVDLKDYSKSVTSEMKTKGGLFSSGLRMPSNEGTVFKNKKVLSCLDNSAGITNYDSGEKSMNIIGATNTGIASLIVKYKTFRGVNMSNCEVVWEYKSDKQPFYAVDEESKVIILSRRKSFEAIDMETGKVLYNYDNGKTVGEKPFFIGGHMYYETGDFFRKFNVRTGEVLAEAKVSGSVKDIRYIEDSYYVVTSQSMNKIDLETLNTKFDKGLKGTDLVWQGESEIYKYYLTSQAESFTLYCFEDDRVKLWTKKINGITLKEAIISDVGVIIGTDKNLLLAQNDEGKDLWNYKSKFNLAMAPNSDESRYYGIVSGYSFHVDMKTGEFTALPKFKLKDFDANKSQSHILVHDDTYIMKSGNNFYIRGLEGEEILTKNYKPHSNASKWAKLGSVVAASGAVATGNAAELVQVSDGTGKVIHQGSMYDNGKYGRNLDDARRRTANSSDLNLPFVFTKIDKKKKVFIFLDPTTGEEYKMIEIREESPSYTVDNADGILFYHNKKTKQLEAHML